MNVSASGSGAATSNQGIKRQITGILSNKGGLKRSTSNISKTVKFGINMTA